MTHYYLGTEIFYLASILPPAVFKLIKRYRQDFLYGNMMADTIIAKRYVPSKRNSHNWPVAFKLYDSAGTNSEKAFALGYLCHLAADTVAHDSYTLGQKNLGHAMLELKADNAVSGSYWLKAVNIDRKVQQRNDTLLEKALECAIFSSRTNRWIFKGMLFFSGLYVGLPSINPENTEELEQLHLESLERMTDMLVNGMDSSVVKERPDGRVKKGWLMGVLLRKVRI